MNYGIYKNIRGAAWQCLIDCNVVSLPVSVSRIMRYYGIDMVYNSNVEILQPSESGRIIVTDKPRVIIRDEHSIQRQRFTAMHELGHYVLGHLGEQMELSRSDIRQPQEKESDMFAVRVLMPACVLWGLDLHSPTEIARICNVSMQAAERRAKRMKELYARNMFLSDPLERKVFEQFKDYIQNNRIQ